MKKLLMKLKMVHSKPLNPKNIYKYKSSHPEDLIIGNKDSPEEQDHSSHKKILRWDCYQ